MGGTRLDIFNLFIEESCTNLDKMEHVLVEMHTHGISQDATDEIFRYIHTLKGSAANFQCKGIADCAHVLEEVMSQFRQDPSVFQREYIALLFEAVDVFRAAFAGVSYAHLGQAGHQNNVGQSLQRKLKQLLPQLHGDVRDDKTIRQWCLTICLHDPYDQDAMHGIRALLRKCMALGDTIVNCAVDDLANIDQLDPLKLSLSWSLTLGKTVTQDKISSLISKFSNLYSFVLTQEKLEIHDDFQLAVVAAREPLLELSKHSHKQPDSQPVQLTQNVPTSITPNQSDILRVSLDKINMLSSAVGELLGKQAELESFFEVAQTSLNTDVQNVNSSMTQILDTLRRSTLNLQSMIMTLRMIKMDSCFDRFQRLCAELSLSQGKYVRLDTLGGDTEVDKFVFEAIVESLMHIIRNAVDHGIESPEERMACHKLEQGVIQLIASQQAGFVVIEVRDDGRGIDYQQLKQKYKNKYGVKADQQIDRATLNAFIFEAGISTRHTASDVSGRGVGMDVVKQNIEQLNGNIQVSDVQQGTCFIMKVPLTLAVLEGQLVQLGRDQFVIPISCIIETVNLDIHRMTKICSEKYVYQFRDTTIPVVPLIGRAAYVDASRSQKVIVVFVADQQYAVVVDDVYGNQQITLKSLDENFALIAGFSGATIFANGKIVLIVDIAHQVKTLQSPQGYTQISGIAGHQ